MVHFANQNRCALQFGRKGIVNPWRLLHESLNTQCLLLSMRKNRMERGDWIQFGRPSRGQVGTIKGCRPHIALSAFSFNSGSGRPLTS